VNTSDHQSFDVLPRDRWQAATNGLIREMVRTDVVVFTAHVDASLLAELRRRCAESDLTKPSWTALVVKAISVSLARHPALNRLVLGGLFRYRPVQVRGIDAVVAVERVRNGEDSVYAQVLRDTDQTPVWELTEELQRANGLEEDDDPRLKLFMRLVKRLPGVVARAIVSAPRLSPKLWREQRGGSFALTTVGKYGVDQIFAKWPWPLSFTFGEVKERPMSVNGVVESRRSFYLTLAWNRELSNGAPVARFFHDVVTALSEATLSADEDAVLAERERQVRGTRETAPAP
jgi:pyruvate/2-oxoglutarate dehydrogenase complex dihydrolipoamide acyltransferase (E2) component